MEPILETHHIPTTQELVLQKMHAVYGDAALFERLRGILSGDSKVSLRLIDWFITNYSKMYNVCYEQAGSEFIVYLRYKAELNCFTKKLFDPFCRGDRIQFAPVEGAKPIETSLGQLNCFAWLFEYGVLEYIEAHMEAIDGDMQKRQTTSRMGSTHETKKVRRPRHELSIAATKTINKHNVEVVVSFK